jgi:hypothetical protein
MVWTCVLAVLCAYGAVMAVWALFGRWFGVPLVSYTEEWVSEAVDGGDFRRRHTIGRLRQ